MDESAGMGGRLEDTRDPRPRPALRSEPRTRMDKQQDSISTVGVGKEYPPSEAYTSEPPPVSLQLIISLAIIGLD